MSIQVRILIVLMLVFFLSAGTAKCAEKPRWELGMGLTFLEMPDYSGSDETRPYLLPYPYFIYRGDSLKIEKDSISGRFFKSDTISWDFSVFGRVPVNSSKNAARQGMADLDPTFEIGPSLNIKLFENHQDHYKLSFILPVRAVFSTDFSSLHREGWGFNPRLIFEKTDLIKNSGLNLGLSAGPMFADSSYNSYYYSVDPVYATSSRPAYAAGGGYSGSTLTVNLNKEFGRLLINTFVSVDFLQGAVNEDSPLIKRDNSVMYGVAASWIFLKSTKLVTTRTDEREGQLLH